MSTAEGRIFGPNGEWIATAKLRSDGDYQSIDERIVACVNALGGIPDPQAAIPALLEACEKLTEWHHMISGPNPRLEGIGFPYTLERAIELSEAALAATKGETR